MNMKPYICIHGHFYQPPRENPWLESVEMQDSAFPYHDWNERVTAECYAPNAAARILDPEGQIIQIANNYQYMSFDFGPTLFSWIKVKKPDLFERIVTADKISMQQFGGHGVAMAQAYNHMILPLAHPRDKFTQIYWGIRDFEFNFGRKPEGMWLPETAVDNETLMIMASLGIKFTILAPHQAKSIKKIGAHQWQSLPNKPFDIKMPYLKKLSNNQSIAIFFYDNQTSHAVAFEQLLSNGENFANRLLSLHDKTRQHPELIHIATDGETYGHHYPHGDMALAYALHHIMERDQAEITVYGQFLELYPPKYEVEIHENTSWSCAHGIERWRSHCGCNSGRKNWQQNWRAPLRQALDWLRDTVNPYYEKAMGAYAQDPWSVRNDYIDCINDRSDEQINIFLKNHVKSTLDDTSQQIFLKWLEVQRHALLMYTSCGWFFDEISGIETVKVMEYASRVIQLVESMCQINLEEPFLNLLEKAPSNIPALANGKKTYEDYVKPAQIDLPKVAATYAIDLIFQNFLSDSKLYCYYVEQQEIVPLETGKLKATLGSFNIRSIITREVFGAGFAVIHQGDHNLKCGIAQFPNHESYTTMIEEIKAAFTSGDFFEVVRLLDQHFSNGATYSLKNLFRDDQRRAIDYILQTALTEADALYRQIGDYHLAMIQFLRDLRVPLPAALQMAVEYVVNANLKRAIAMQPYPDLTLLQQSLEQADLHHLTLDKISLVFLFEERLAELISQLNLEQNDELLEQTTLFSEFIRQSNFEVNLWQAQNIFWAMIYSENTLQLNAELLKKLAFHLDIKMD